MSRESRDSDADLPAGLRQPLKGYLTSRGKGPDGSSGHYRRNAERELERFSRHLVGEQNIEDLAEVDARTLRVYVRDGLRDRDLAPPTVWKYYDIVSAWIGWAQREGLVSEHYGIQDIAREPLPSTDAEERDEQTWHREERQQFLAHLDERARDAVDTDGLDASVPVRDRALGALLAYTGVRGSEVLADSADDRRIGASWRHLGEDLTSLTVLGKSQEWETRSVPPQARPALERWDTVLDPEPDWPIVPSFHRPSLYRSLPADTDTESLDGLDDVFEAYRAADCRPPALTTDGARRLFEQLTDEAGIEVEEGYLQLHGARRGVGRVLAMQQSAEDAADQLGNSVAVVEEAYSEVLAEERAEATGEAFEAHDSRDEDERA